jgi:anti-anti-sigma factor
MSEKPDAPSITAERHGAAIIARANVKLLAEQELKTLIRLIDQWAGGAGVTLVVIDLTGVQLLPSLALGLLMQISRKCKASNQALKLACVDPKVRQVFAITRLDRIFEFCPSVEAAVG